MPPTQKSTRQWLPLLIVISLACLASVGAYYLYWQQVDRKVGSSSPPETPIISSNTEPDQSTSEPVIDTVSLAPDIPLVDEPRNPELPNLSDSDEYLRLHWPERGLPASTEAWLLGEFIIQRAVSFIDGLANGALLHKLTPLNVLTSNETADIRPKATFQVSQRDGELWLNDANFDRYSKFTEFLLSIEPTKLAGAFHWLRPLLERAYGELGQPAEQLGNRLIIGLDILLKSPDIETPIKLKRESVYYHFADPALEALPDSQKLLLRIGPKNRAVIKQWLRSLKQALLKESSGKPE